MATAAPRGALKSKQLYPGFLRGVREKCACLSSSLQTRVHRLPLLSAGSPAVRKRTEAFSPSLLFDYLCPLLCRGCCFMASIKVGQAPLPSVLMLSFKSLKVALLPLRQRPLPVRSELGVMGKRKEPHSDQDERDGERGRKSVVAAAGIFSASSALPSFSPSRCLSLHHYRHQRWKKRKEGDAARPLARARTPGGTSRSLVTPTAALAA